MISAVRGLRGPCGSRAALGCLLTSVASTLILVLPGVSLASSTFGDSLGIPESLIKLYPPCGAPCTVSTTVSPEHLAWFRAPATGTIVRWRIQTIAGSAPQMIALRVLAPVAGDAFTEAPGEEFTGAGTSAGVPAPTTPGTFTFPTRLPVLAGDFLGLDTEGGTLAAVAVEEESIRMFAPPPVDFGAPTAGAHQKYALLVNADVVAPPTSGAVAACSPSGAFDVTVTPDFDPTVAAEALRVRIDSGAEQVLPARGDPGIASIVLPRGTHALEYWGEDTLGQQEAAHHSATVLVNDAPPSITISSDQGRTVYPQGASASITIAAGDTLDALQSDPSDAHVTIATHTPGTFTVTRTAVDRCGNSATASYTYSVTPAARITHLRVAPASFSESRAGRRLQRAGPGATRTGTRTEITYTDSQAATAAFVVQRALRGTRRAGRCVAPTSRLGRNTRLCTRLLRLGSFTHGDRAGTNRFRMPARVGGAVLPPGAYRLQARATVAGGEPGPPADVALHIPPM
jgi:hypothetical protein